MLTLIAKSWLTLLDVEVWMRTRRYSALRRRLRSCPTSLKILASSGDITRAMDLAVVFFFKRVKCLQRSTATALVLKRHGHAAELVVGIEMHPFQSHAWVELRGSIVNDKPYIRDMYREIERY